MQTALANQMPTYSGGLGVLAGDLLRSAADLGLPLVGVSLLHRKGYFSQGVEAEGRQSEDPVSWTVDDFLQPLAAPCQIEVEGRPVTVRAWRYLLQGAGGAEVPVFFLDTDVSDNAPFDRTLTDHLYGGDERYRLCQEVVLGGGGVRRLWALGSTDVERFHLHEGHAALLALELFTDEQARSPEAPEPALAPGPRRRVCTTPPPGAAGQDPFPLPLARQVLRRDAVQAGQRRGGWPASHTMPVVALPFSPAVNGAAKRPGALARPRFPSDPRRSITPGGPAGTWTAPAWSHRYAQEQPAWRQAQFALRSALDIPLQALGHAHAPAKHRRPDARNRRLKAGFDPDGCTLGCARRPPGSKRPSWLWHDIAQRRHRAKRAAQILPVYPDEPLRWAEIMRETLAVNASGFNTPHRLLDYLMDADPER